METINDRLEQIINALFNGNKAAFAKSIDLPPTGMSNYIGNKRRSIPSSEIASKIVLSRYDIDKKQFNGNDIIGSDLVGVGLNPLVNSSPNGEVTRLGYVTNV